MPGALALLAVCLAQNGYSGRQPNVPRLIAMAVFGYIVVTSIKVFWALGELGAMPAAAAVITSVVSILAIGLFLLRRQV